MAKKKEMLTLQAVLIQNTLLDALDLRMDSFKKKIDELQKNLQIEGMEVVAPLMRFALEKSRSSYMEVLNRRVDSILLAPFTTEDCVLDYVGDHRKINADSSHIMCLVFYGNETWKNPFIEIQNDAVTIYYRLSSNLISGFFVYQDAEDHMIYYPMNEDAHKYSQEYCFDLMRIIPL